MGNTNNKALRREGHLHAETRNVMLSLPNKFKELLLKKSIKFFLKYNSYKKIVYKKFSFTIGKDIEEGIETISICHPFFDEFDEELSESIVIGRIKRMRGDLKWKKPIENIYGEIILDENGDPIIQYIRKYYKPYDLDAKVLDNDGKETNKLKYPYIWRK